MEKLKKATIHRSSFTPSYATTLAAGCAEARGTLNGALASINTQAAEKSFFFKSFVVVIFFSVIVS